MANWRRQSSTAAQGAPRQEGLSPRLELCLLIGLAAIYLVWFARPLWWAGTESARLVGALGTDEQEHLLLLKEAIDQRTVRLGYYPYGYAYFYAALLPLLLLSHVRIVSEQQIILWLRVMVTLSAVGSVALTFAIARRYLGRVAAWLSVLLLSVSVLTFLSMSVKSHTDIPQLVLLLLAVYLCCRFLEDGRLRWWTGASAAAGVAFSCKYSGLLLLPVMWLFGALHSSHLPGSQIKPRSGQVVLLARLLAVVAGMGLLIGGSVVIPRAAAAYGDAEYFGVSLPVLSGSLRLVTLFSGIVLVLLASAWPVWALVLERPRLARTLELGMLSGGAFALAVVLTSPLHIFNVRSGVLRGFLYESLHAAFGHSFQAQTSRWEWLSILASAQLVNPVVLALAVLGLALWALRLGGRGRQALLEPQAVLWLWTLGYLGLLLWRVNTRTYRAMLPVVPFLLMLAANGIQQVMQYAATKVSRRLLSLLTAVAVLAVLVPVLPPSVQRVLAFRRSTVNHAQYSDAVLAGQWLAATYSPATRVLYDPRCYVPPAFSDAQVTAWGGTLQLLEELQPDVVMVHSYHTERFSDPGMADAYAREEAEFLARYDYYATLRSGEAGYTLQRDFGSVQVYSRRRD